MALIMDQSRSVLPRPAVAKARESGGLWRENLHARLGPTILDKIVETPNYKLTSPPPPTPCNVVVGEGGETVDQ